MTANLRTHAEGSGEGAVTITMALTTTKHDGILVIYSDKWDANGATSVTWNGGAEAFTLVHQAVVTASLEFWWLPNPTPGTFNVVVNNDTITGIAVAAVITGARFSQERANATGNGNSAEATITVASVKDDLVFAALKHDSNGAWAEVHGHELYGTALGGTDAYWIGYDVAGGATTEVAASQGGAEAWRSAGISIYPAAVGGDAIII